MKKILSLIFFLFYAGAADATAIHHKHRHRHKPIIVPAASAQLEKCLKKADDLPDMAAADAGAWIKRGGGNDAHLCHAFADTNRGMHAEAAHEFWALAVYYDKNDQRRAVLMHNMAGQEYLRSRDISDAESQYGFALMIAPQSVMSLIGHAEVLMAKEKYWDAIDDLNKALKLEPNNVDALRQRGRAWIQLDNDKNAQVDFGRAAQLAGDK